MEAQRRRSRKKKRAPKNIKAEGPRPSASAQPKTVGTPQKPFHLSAQELGAIIRTHLLRGGTSREIPFLLPTFKKRTQVVEIALITDYISITFTNATQYNTVQTFIFSSFGNNGDLKNTFDEQRALRGRCYYIPRFVYGGNSSQAAVIGQGGAVVEYANNTVLGSSASLLQHDNHVLFNILALTERGQKDDRAGTAQAIWPILVDNMPDQEWQDSNSPTAFAYWKPFFNAGDVTVTGTYGYLVAEMSFQFRGLK